MKGAPQGALGSTFSAGQTVWGGRGGSLQHVKNQLRPEGWEGVGLPRAQEQVFWAEEDYVQRAEGRPILVQLEHRKQLTAITEQGEETSLQRSQRSVLSQPLSRRSSCIQYIHHRLRANDKRSHKQGLLKFVKKLCFYMKKH